MRNGEEFVG